MCRGYRIRYEIVQKGRTLESDRYGSRLLSSFYMLSDLEQVLESICASVSCPIKWRYPVDKDIERVK